MGVLRFDRKNGVGDAGVSVKDIEALECSALGDVVGDQESDSDFVSDASLERDTESVPVRAGGLNEVDLDAAALSDGVGDP